MADYDIGSAFAQIEDELIASMTRNLKRHTVEEAAEGYEWAQWQALQLQALEDYKRRAAAKYGAKFSSINDKIEESITASYNTAQTQQEKEILRRIQSGIPEAVSVSQGTASVTGEFFKTNDRKLEALVKATTNDMQRAETAVLRMTNDKYRSIIFNAQVYANTGAGTYKKAVDMATKDFLAAGINCIEYKNGRRVNIKSYAEMALRTANKRAYLQGEGEMRKKWGIHTVILNKRTNACPKCSRFVGQVIVDDVWSGGTAQEAQKGGYLLMSECINEGLYHPNCQDSHTTYFGDILDDEEPQEEQGEQEEPDTGNEQEPINEQSKPAEQPFTPEEQQLSEQLYQAQQRENYCERQTERFERLSKYSLDEGNVREYKARTREWEERLAKVKQSVNNLKNSIAKSVESGIIELTRKRDINGELKSFISDKRFNELTIEARLTGAEIIRDDPWFNARMEEQNASAITYGSVLVFGKNATVSDVIEETYHYKQNLQGLNSDKPHELRIILNEIDAKKYLIENAKKFKIPRAETELTKQQLASYIKQLEDWYKRGEQYVD